MTCPHRLRPDFVLAEQLEHSRNRLPDVEDVGSVIGELFRIANTPEEFKIERRMRRRCCILSVPTTLGGAKQQQPLLTPWRPLDWSPRVIYRPETRKGRTKLYWIG